MMQEVFSGVELPNYFWIRFIVTMVVLALIPSLRYISKKFVYHAGFLTSKSSFRIDHTYRIIGMCINITCVVIVAILWGVDPSRVIVVLSSVFAVIGVAMFAQWSVLSNITSGLVIFFSMPFRIGDEIEIVDKDNPIRATVENVLTFTIHLRKDNGDLVIMSNTIFMQKVISVKEKKD